MTEGASVRILVRVVSAVLLVTASCSVSGASVAGAASPVRYSQRLVDVCLHKHKVAFGYAYGHGGFPSTVTGFTNLNGPPLNTEPIVIGDGVMVFEKNAMDAAHDKIKVATSLSLTSLSPTALRQQVSLKGNVIIFWQRARHDPRLGNEIVANCLTAGSLP